MVTRTRAYCSQEDEKARYKNLAVTKVIRRLHKKTHTTILGACTTDITNQDTAGGLEDHHTVTTVASAHATIENAEYLLKTGLAQQVVVLEHTPRHDNLPKAELASLANTTLHRAREQSEFSEHILVGVHTGLEVEGEERTKRFTNHRTSNNSGHKKIGANDGLHMYSQAGAVAFTTSLTHILDQAGLVRQKRQPAAQPSSTSAPGAWQTAGPGRGFNANRRNHNNQNQQQQNHFTIPTQNQYQGFW